MDISTKPMWKEGLFMMPQHLQLLDSYHEHLLDSRFNSVLHYPWGIFELEIEEDELARGMFSLSRCFGVMPDGLVVKIGGGEAQKGVATSVGSSLRGDRKTMEVFLGVPSASVGGVSPEGAGTTGTRYLHLDQSIPDIFGLSSETDVECIRPNVRLIIGQEDRQNFVTIKIAELVLEETGKLAVSERYVPPCLKIRVASPLMKRLVRLVSAMSAKQKDLVEKYGSRVSSMVEFGATDMVTFLYLHTINTWLPIFLHYADSGELHPEELYLALASFAGQLTSFEATTDPLDLPRFHYLDLASTFFPLFDKIFKLLGTVVSSRYRTIPLEQTQPGLFISRIDDPQLLRNSSLFLIAGGDVPEELLRDDLPRYIKVGSVDQIAKIVHSALPGVAVAMDYAPPSGIPVRAHMVYLRLDKQGRYWESVLQSGTLAVYQPVKPERVKLEFIALESG